MYIRLFVEDYTDYPSFLPPSLSSFFLLSLLFSSTCLYLCKYRNIELLYKISFWKVGFYCQNTIWKSPDWTILSLSPSMFWLLLGFQDLGKNRKGNYKSFGLVNKNLSWMNCSSAKKQSYRWNGVLQTPSGIRGYDE
jgi:hypothetical protein